MSNPQPYKIMLRDTFKAIILRIKNWDAQRWYERYGNNDSKH